VIVDNFDLVCIAIAPSKTDAPLVIDSDAVLASAVASQFLQAIPRRRQQVLERIGRVHKDELPKHGALQRPRKPPHRFSAEETLSVAVGKAPNHDE
jgi:hypothetical protein